jgi:integrase
MSSIRKRTWVGPDGQAKSAWQVDYKDQQGKRRSKQFHRKKEAERWAINAAAEVQRGVHTPDSTSITVAEAAERWIDAVRANGREPTTIAAYEQHVRLHILPKCGARKLSQLTSPEVKRISDEWLNQLSRPMAVRVLRSLKAILTEAQEAGLVAQNVALAVKPRKVTREKGKVTPPSKETLRAILAAASASSDLKARAALELAIFTGLRASELRGLAWHSVDLASNRLTVTQRADAQGKIGPPKSAAGHRTIALPSRVVKVLKEWKLACPVSDLALVFPSQRKKPLSHRVLMCNHVVPVFQQAHVGPLGLHALRHAAASLWIEQGLNGKRVQVLMGHSSIQVTFDTYGHLFDQAQRDAEDAAAIERALFADAT